MQGHDYDDAHFQKWDQKFHLLLVARNTYISLSTCRSVLFREKEMKKKKKKKVTATRCDNFWK